MKGNAMDRASYAKAHMMAKAMVRIHTESAPYTDGEVDRVNHMYDWFKQTGRTDIIREAEKFRDARLHDLGIK